MKLFKSKINSQKGSTLIEVLISIAVVSFLTVTIYMTLTSAISNMSESKQRVSAIAIANEKMEIIRNLDYEEVGVLNGIISGPMLAFEVVTRNDFDYNVYIDIRYIDDPLDGTDSDDLINTDYKLVQVTAEWEHQGKVDSVEFISSFVPNGIETNMGGGSLVLNTMTSGGSPVGNVSVNLKSIEDTPAVDYSTNTDNSGSLTLQGVPSQTYRITLSKDDYESVRTYPNPPDSSFTPFNADFYINESVLNSKNFFIDPASNLNLKAINIADDSGIVGIDIELIGGKEIGSEPVTYNLDDSSITDSSGEINYSDISPGSYQIVNWEDLGIDDYTFIGSTEETTFDLAVEDNLEIELLFGDKDTSSLYLKVIDEMTNDPIQGAGVGVINSSDFDQGTETSEGGTVFFPLVVNPQVLMEDGDYTLEVRMNGYEDYSEELTISRLTTKEIKLTPQ